MPFRFHSIHQIPLESSTHPPSTILLDLPLTLKQSLLGFRFRLTLGHLGDKQVIITHEGVTAHGSEDCLRDLGVGGTEEEDDQPRQETMTWKEKKGIKEEGRGHLIIRYSVQISEELDWWDRVMVGRALEETG